MLIIDDNKEMVNAVSVELSNLFDAVEEASTVDEAEKLLAKNTYALILLEINLGGRNGAEVIKYLIGTPNNPNISVPFIIVSEIITPQFIERHQKRFAGILMKPFDPENLRKTAEEILVAGQKIEESNSPPVTPYDEIPYLKCELPFPIAQLEQRVNKIMDQVKKSAKLKQLFTQMNIDRDPNNYLLVHIGMLINISTALCIQMEWNTDKTLEKFVYAAYLHDMALANRPDLAGINTFEELEAQKDTLPPAEYRIVFEHPNIAANSIEAISEIPPDVAMIIRQHHELPKGNGFPIKCGYQKIVPLSVVFIIAHDLTEYVLANPKWNIEEYIKISRSRFKGSHFSKILFSLAEIK